MTLTIKQECNGCDRSRYLTSEDQQTAGHWVIVKKSTDGKDQHLCGKCVSNALQIVDAAKRLGAINDG